MRDRWPTDAEDVRRRKLDSLACVYCPAGEGENHVNPPRYGSRKPKGKK